MQRREVLRVTGLAGLASIAGCLGGNPETEGDDGNPIEAKPEDLLPEADLFGDKWDQIDEEPTGLHSVDLEGNAASTSFVANEGQEGIDVEVTVFDTVDGAMSGYQKMRDSDFAGDGSLADDVGIASEGHLMDLDTIFVYFRDANVIGSLVHIVRGSSNSTEYAANWHKTWRD